ncbi:MAG: hypothetical protein WCP01_10190 [Methylococcaceae bacterium]
MKQKLLTLRQAEKAPGIYELVTHQGLFNFRLMTKIDTEESLNDAMLRIQERDLIVLIVMQNKRLSSKNDNQAGNFASGYPSNIPYNNDF